MAKLDCLPDWSYHHGCVKGVHVIVWKDNRKQGLFHDGTGLLMNFSSVDGGIIWREGIRISDPHWMDLCRLALAQELNKEVPLTTKQYRVVQDFRNDARQLRSSLQYHKDRYTECKRLLHQLSKVYPFEQTVNQELKAELQRPFFE